jgi:hypothetical protein
LKAESASIPEQEQEQEQEQSRAEQTELFPHMCMDTKIRIRKYIGNHNEKEEEEERVQDLVGRW